MGAASIGLKAASTAASAASSGKGGSSSQNAGPSPQQAALAQYTMGQETLASNTGFAKSGLGASTMKTFQEGGEQIGGAAQLAGMADQNASQLQQLANTQAGNQGFNSGFNSGGNTGTSTGNFGNTPGGSTGTGLDTGTPVGGDTAIL